MKNKYELNEAARSVANTLTGETSHKSMRIAVLEQSNKLGVPDADFADFEQSVYQIKATNEQLKARPTESERLRTEAARVAEIEAKKAGSKNPVAAAE